MKPIKCEKKLAFYWLLLNFSFKTKLWEPQSNRLCKGWCNQIIGRIYPPILSEIGTIVFIIIF